MVCRRGRDSIYTPMTAQTDLYVSVIQQRSAVTLIFAVFLQPVCNKLMVFLSENVAFRSQLNRLFKMRATPKTSQRENKMFFWRFSQCFLIISGVSECIFPNMSQLPTTPLSARTNTEVNACLRNYDFCSIRFLCELWRTFFFCALSWKSFTVKLPAEKSPC